MAKYYRQQGETKQRKLLRIVRPVMLFVFIGALGTMGWFLYDVFKQDSKAETSSQATKPTSSTIASNVQIQTTPYFQIQTPIKWRAVANETRDGHYVYRQFNGQLVEQNLTIDVNDSSQVNLAISNINRVLPITASSDGTISMIEVPLDHCKKVAGGKKDQFMAVMDRVSFPCNPDSTGYEAVVGIVNGSNIMSLMRPSGSKAVYKITYQNVSATPSSRDLLNIVKSFETR